MELITIVPEPGMAKYIGQDLLFLANHPSEVVSVSRPQPGFQVTEELYDRFVAFQKREGSVEEIVPTELEETSTPVVAPKRGRPKRNVEAD